MSTLFTLARDVESYAPCHPDDYDPDFPPARVIIPAGTRVTLRRTYHGTSHGFTPDQWSLEATAEGFPYLARIAGSDVREDVAAFGWCDNHYPGTDIEGYPIAVSCGGVMRTDVDAYACERGCYYAPPRNAAEEAEEAFREMQDAYYRVGEYLD